jgi:hypothetical protein
MWRIVSLVGLLLATVGVAAEKKSDTPVVKPEVKPGVAIVKEWTGAFSRQETANRVVVKDQKAWEDLWAIMNGRIRPQPELPKIDFDKQMVIGVFMGSRNSGGYSVKITGIESNGKLTVKVKETSPGRGMAGAAALTQPYHVVLVPKSDKPVEFVDEK